MQYVSATLRRRGALLGIADNQPVLLMAGEEILEDNLRHLRLSHDELMAQLRKAGILRRSEVAAVVMETAGNVSVLRSGQGMDPELLAGVRGAERILSR